MRPIPNYHNLFCGNPKVIDDVFLEALVYDNNDIRGTQGV
jgi:hypothetical protein